MATNDTKRFYWLKLHKDFFKQHEIKIVEGMPNGKDYVLFYLKLLVESVSHEGDLRFSDTIPYSEQMLSILTDTNIDVVRSAMKIFTDLKMIEVLDDATIHMAEVQKLIGSETGKAQRMREYREKINATDGLQSGYNVAKRLEIRDKNISGGGNSSVTEKVNLDCKNKYLINTENSSNLLENNKEKTTATTALKEYEKNISPLKPETAKRLKSLIQECGEKTVIDAIHEAVSMNVLNYKYIAAITRGHQGKKRIKPEPGEKGYRHIDPNCPECRGTGEVTRYIDGNIDLPMKIDCPICCRH